MNKKMWYVYSGLYYSAIKRNDIGSFVETWMDLESVIQSEVRKRKTNIIYQHIYVESAKTGISNLIYKVEIETQKEKRTYGYQGGKRG